MLDVLRHQDLEGVLATVVRYFGGIKLGAGGLVRAYTDSVAQALLTAEKVAIVRQVQLACTAPYAQEGMIRRELDAAGATLLAVSHGEAVVFTLQPGRGAGAAARRTPERGRPRPHRLAARRRRTEAALSGRRIPDITSRKRTDCAAGGL